MLIKYIIEIFEKIIIPKIEIRSCHIKLKSCSNKVKTHDSETIQNKT